MLERVVDQFTALAIVESGKRPLEPLAAQARLGEAAERAARLSSQSGHAARALVQTKRRRDFIRQPLQRRPGLQQRKPMRLLADRDAANWLSYGRTYSEQRFSPLTKITSDNAKQLGLAWFADLDTNRGQEATPLVIDGVMYVSTAWSMVKASPSCFALSALIFDSGLKRCSLYVRP